MLLANRLINVSEAMAVAGPDPFKPWIGPDFPFWHYSLKVLAILSAMVGVLFLILALWKRLAPRYQRHPALIRILATHYLAPKQALILVAVGEETFLLASSASNLSVIPVNRAVSEKALEPLPPPQS